MNTNIHTAKKFPVFLGFFVFDEGVNQTTNPTTTGTMLHRLTQNQDATPEIMSEKPRYGSAVMPVIPPLKRRRSGSGFWVMVAYDAL